ncbi:hypothetical protein Rctr197k_140 [Virus Rctr197k]|nr:hypothetical protein Rctr197k_140 [Virus Rctr197k]
MRIYDGRPDPEKLRTRLTKRQRIHGADLVTMVDTTSTLATGHPYQLLVFGVFVAGRIEERPHPNVPSATTRTLVLADGKKFSRFVERDGRYLILCARTRGDGKMVCTDYSLQQLRVATDEDIAQAGTSDAIK